jgi:hypothetical protein
MTLRGGKLVLAALLALTGLGLAHPEAANAVDEPKRISVCIDRPSCSTVVTPLFETEYVPDVLPNEWYCSWSANALKAGAVAVRTYGWWRKEHPRSTAFDIYDDASDQVYVAGVSHQSGAAPCNSAVAATAGTRVEYSAARINAQYRAETGNPTASGGTSYLVSVSDPHTSVGTLGPGLCQRGSQSYGANGTSFGAILRHYYTGVSVTIGAYYYLSETCTCTTTGCYRTEYWKDTASGSVITRVYAVGVCRV